MRTLPPSRLRRVEPALRRALEGACAVPAGSRVLVAVSGGADSTALLLGFSRLARERGIEIRAAHLHHGLRGREADGDRDFVRELCERLQVPLHDARWNCAARMSRRGLSGHAGLRRLRQEFLLAAARRAGAVAIATAHTADDQLETLLIRLTRGTGLAGLAGIPARRGPWIRPLLEITRPEIVADLEAAGIGWREDSSNRDPAYLRSRIRHEAIPALASAAGLAGPRRTVLARHAARIAAEAAAARRTSEAAAKRLLAGACRTGSGAVRLDPRGVSRCSAPVRRAVLGSCWSRLNPSHDGLTDRHLLALEHLLSSSRIGARLNLPAGVVALREPRWLRLERSNEGGPDGSTGSRSGPMTHGARRRSGGGNDPS